MKKILSTFIALIIAVCMGCSLTGCNVVISGTIDEIAGTYELTEKKFDEEDILKRDEIVSYLVIGKENKGYFYYKDKDMKKYLCQEINISYIADEEEPTKYSYIEYTLSEKEEYDYDDIHELVVNNSIKTLSTGNVKIGDIKSRRTEYTKINDDVTMTTVNEKLNMEVKPVAVENMEFYYTYSLLENYIEVDTNICKNTEYKYLAIDFDLDSDNATVTYCLKDSLEQKTATVKYSIDRTGEKTNVTIDGVVFENYTFRRFKGIKEIEGKQYEMDFFSGEGYSLEVIKHA